MHNRKIRLRLAVGSLMAALLLAGCSGKIDPSATLVNIDKGDGKITLGYGNFVARYNQASYDKFYLSQYDSTYWRSSPDGESEKTMEDSVKDDVMDELKKMYLSAKHAEEYDVKISEDQEKKIKEVVDKFMKDNSKEALEDMGATEEYVSQMIRENIYEQELEKAMTKKKKKELTPDDVRQAKVSYVHLFMGGLTDDDGNVKDVSLDELKERAEKVASAENMEEAAKESGFDLDEDYYTIAKDADGAAEDMDVPKVVAEAAIKLKEGEISEVIQAEHDGNDGYYVVRKDKDFDKDYTKVKKTSLSEQFYSDTMEEWTDDLDWAIDEKQWAKVKFDTAFEAPEEEEEDEKDGEAAGDAVESEGAEISVEPSEGEGAGEATEENAEDAGEATEENADDAGEAAEENADDAGEAT
ncbi:MAG: peptidyl-prolyl cis-trans isomerase, partial [Lachnospiraceae bacterium]|nr:peptidyl-prolyl cis-trans isomerase [Lachnospiraceae bacterium]